MYLPRLTIAIAAATIAATGLAFTRHTTPDHPAAVGVAAHGYGGPETFLPDAATRYIDQHCPTTTNQTDLSGIGGAGAFTPRSVPAVPDLSGIGGAGAFIPHSIPGGPNMSGIGGAGAFTPATDHGDA